MFVTALLVVHAAATLFMTGLIWFVQQVHYPLAAQVGASEFVAYQNEHLRRTTWVVVPPMVLEMMTTLALLVVRPPGVAAWISWLGAGLLLAVWLSTVALQVPLHSRLTHGRDDHYLNRLVETNWIRTVGWTARGGLALWMLAVCVVPG